MVEFVKYKYYYALLTAFIMGGMISNFIGEHDVNASGYVNSISKQLLLMQTQFYYLDHFVKPDQSSLRYDLKTNIESKLNYLQRYLTECIEDEDSLCSPSVKKQLINTLNNVTATRDKLESMTFPQ